MDNTSLVYTVKRGGKVMIEKKRKGIPPPRYDEAFKAGAIRLVTEQKRSPGEVTKELVFHPAKKREIFAVLFPHGVVAFQST